MALHVGYPGRSSNCHGAACPFTSIKKLAPAQSRLLLLLLLLLHVLLLLLLRLRLLLLTMLTLRVHHTG